LYPFIKKMIQEMKIKEHVFLKQIFQNLQPVCKTPADYLFMSNMYLAVQEKLYSKVKQIERDEYNWLNEDMIRQTNARMRANIDTPIVSYETAFVTHTDDDKHHLIDAIVEKHLPESYNKEVFRFSARVDMVCAKTVWELKFVKELNHEHFLQFAIYAWLWKCVHGLSEGSWSEETDKQFRLFNVRTGEIWTLKEDCFEDLTHIVVFLLGSKYHRHKTVPDGEFLDTVFRSG